jgi:hypothetical protein
MNENTDRELALEEEDRLPWLEAVDSDEEAGVSKGKLLGLLAAAALALAVVVGGVSWLRSQKAGNSDSTMITAPDGDYKSRPTDVGGMKVDGQGDAALATSEGTEANGKLDMNAQPETPVVGTKAPTAVASKPIAAGTPSATAAIAAGGNMPTAPTPTGAGPALASATVPGAAMVQIGAYGSEAEATQAWAAVSRKIPAIAGMGKSIVPAVVNGKTWYRLRLAAGGDPAGACAKVRAGGGSCMVVK